MRQRIVVGVLTSALEHLLENLDLRSLLSSNSHQRDATLHASAFHQFALPLRISSSLIAQISSSYDEETSTFSLKLESLKVACEFWETPHSSPNSITKRLAGWAGVQIIVHSIDVTVEPDLQILLENISIKWGTSFRLDNLRVLHNSTLVCEKDRIDGEWDSTVRCHIESLRLSFTLSLLDSLSRFIGRRRDAGALGGEVQIGSIECGLNGVRCLLSHVTIDNCLRIGRLAGSFFAFENLVWDENGLRIQELSSDSLRQADVDIPVLRPTQNGYLLGNLVFSGSFDLWLQNLSLVVQTFQLLRGLSSGKVIEIPQVRLIFDSGFTAACRIMLSFDKEIKLCVENGILVHQNSEPIVTDFQCRFVLSEQQTGLNVSPFELRVTFAELQKIMDPMRRFAKLLGRQFNHSIRSSSVVLCREVCGRKHNFLKVVLKELTAGSILRGDSMNIVVSLTSSIHFWNSKTSSWDCLVPAFCGLITDRHAVQTGRSILECTINPISVNFTTAFLTSITEEGRWGSESIRIQNLTRHGIRVGDILLHRLQILELSDPTIRFSELNQTIKIWHVKTAIFLDENLVLTPSRSEGGKLLTISGRYALENKTDQPLMVFRFNYSSMSIEQILPEQRVVLGNRHRELLFSFGLSNPHYLPKSWMKLTELPQVFSKNGITVVFREVKEGLCKVLQILPYYYFKNDLPFRIFCTFASRSEHVAYDLPPGMTQAAVQLETNFKLYSITLVLDQIQGTSESRVFDRFPQELVFCVSGICFRAFLNEVCDRHLQIRFYVPLVIVNNTNRDLFFKIEGRC
jgi:hypothetical protein